MFSPSKDKKKILSLSHSKFEKILFLTKIKTILEGTITENEQYKT